MFINKKHFKTLIFLMSCFIILTTGILRVEAKSCMLWEGRSVGWVTREGNTFYFHKTNGPYYRKGEPCVNDFKWRGNKLYYFCEDGRMLKHDTKYIKLNRDHSVHYIYIPGTHHNDRYNARLKRYQKHNRRVHWIEYGMQTSIPWMCDWQK